MNDLISTLRLPNDASAILANCRAIGPRLAELAPEGEQLRQLPDEAVALMRAAGGYRIAMPRAWGGPETTPTEQVLIIEELCKWSGAAGWCAMIGSDGGYYSAGLDQQVARAMWADIDTPTGSTAFPPGRAVAVEGGYRITGRWPYGSGNSHSGWMGGHCLVYDGETPRPGPNGPPQTLLAFIPAAEFDTFDTWNTTGLRGSGSCDWGATDRFVPAERCLPSFGVARPQREGALYQFPMMFLCNQPGVPFGLARAALEEFRQLAETKARFGGGIRDDSNVQSALGMAHARYRSARAYVIEVLDDLHATLSKGENHRWSSVPTSGSATPMRIRNA
jgi:alkylation response protein AidB-like acyl-CoA dehydrogenase